MSSEDFTRKIVDQFNTLLGHNLIDMPIGAILCVHDDPRLYSPLDWDFGEKDTYTFSMKIETHVLLEGESCDSPLGKTQYGPKTPEIEREIQQIVSQEKPVL